MPESSYNGGGVHTQQADPADPGVEHRIAEVAGGEAGGGPPARERDGIARWIPGRENPNVRPERSGIERPPPVRPLRFHRSGTTLTATIRDGEGPPLVLLPGVMADAASWQPVVDHLEGPSPVVTIDRRGREPSGPSAPAIRCAPRSTTCTTCSTSSAAASRCSAGATAASSRWRPPPNAGFSTEYVAALRSTPTWPALRRLAPPLADELTALDAHHPALHRYPKLPIPVTLLLGELNEGRPPYGTTFTTFTAALPQATVVRLPGQGHLAHAQAPDVLARHLTAAFTANPQRARPRPGLGDRGRPQPRVVRRARRPARATTSRRRGTRPAFRVTMCSTSSRTDGDTTVSAARSNATRAWACSGGLLDLLGRYRPTEIDHRDIPLLGPTPSAQCDQVKGFPTGAGTATPSFSAAVSSSAQTLAATGMPLVARCCAVAEEDSPG